MTRITRFASLAALGFGLLASSAQASFSVLWSGRSAGSYFAQVDVPAACSVQIYPYVSGSGGGYDTTVSNTWYSNYYYYDTWELYSWGGRLTSHQLGLEYQADWGSAYVTNNNDNYGQVEAYVYGAQNGYFKGEARSTLYPSLNYSMEYGSPTADTYLVEISGLVDGDGQATVTVNISW